MSLFPWHEKGNQILLFIKLTPKAAHDRIQGIFFDPSQQAYLKVSVTAPPVDGRANKALIQLIAKKIGIAATKITFVRGEGDRYKVLSLHQDETTLLHLQQTLLP